MPGVDLHQLHGRAQGLRGQLVAAARPDVLLRPALHLLAHAAADAAREAGDGDRRPSDGDRAGTTSPAPTRRRRSWRRSSSSSATRSASSSSARSCRRACCSTGRPGTGKTLLARAIANESGAKFYAQSASAFVEMFAGPRRGADPQALRRGAQERARRSSSSTSSTPSAPRAPGTASTASRIRRSTSCSSSSTASPPATRSSSWAPRTVCRISIRRCCGPGRFDRQVLVAPPDLAGREAILARPHARRSRSPRTSSST